MGSCCLCGFIFAIIIIPPEGEWDLVVVWFHLRYYYYPIPPEGEWDLLLCGFIFAIIIIIGVVVVVKVGL